MKITKNLRAITCIFAAVLSTTSCIRYVPPRGKSMRIGGNGKSTLSGDIGSPSYEGEEAFYAIQRENERRLKKLVEKRLRDRSAVAESSYRIGPGDLLDLAVFDVSELNRKVRVRPDGIISLPLVGMLKAEGLTEEELQTELAKRLKEYMYNPQVQVFISDYSAHKVSVIGEVNNPGAYPLRRNDYSLLELISKAGGRTDKAGGLVLLIPAADPRGAKTEKSKTGERARLRNKSKYFGVEIDFDKLVGSIENPPLNIPLLPGDTIVVPEAGTIQVDGEVVKPGSFAVASKMTLLGAIASAGGLTYSADVSQVEILRELGSGKKAILSVNLEKLAFGQGKDIRLRDSDVIRVPSSPGRFATRQVVDALNGIFNFGVSGTVGP